MSDDIVVPLTSGKVVPIGGRHIPDNTLGQPVERVVEELTALLDRAKRGEVVAFAVAYIDGGDRIGTGWQISAVGCSRMISGVTLLNHEMCSRWLEET